MVNNKSGMLPLRYSLALLAALFISGMASANVVESGKITNIIVEGNTIASVWLDGADDNSECSANGRWTVATSDGLFKEKLAALMSAASMGKTVRLFHLTGWGCGNWDSNKIYYINVDY